MTPKPGLGVIIFIRIKKSFVHFNWYRFIKSNRLNMGSIEEKFRPNLNKYKISKGW